MPLTTKRRTTSEVRNMIEVRVRRLNERSYDPGTILTALEEIRELAENQINEIESRV